MSDTQQEQDRTEAATPYKLREAKRQGQVSKSVEVNSLLALATALGLSYGLGQSIIQDELEFSRSLFQQAHLLDIHPERVVTFFSGIYSTSISIFWLPIAAILAIAVLSNILQTGPVLAGEALKPNFQRLNPAKNLKRLFSAKILYESTKTVFKVALLAGVTYLAIDAMLPELVATMDKHPDTYPPILLDVARGLVFKLLIVLLFVALIDVMYTRWDFAKQMRMSRREIKEEVKRREGDPLVRAKIRELQKEAAKRAGSLQRVPEADVLITNPTHLSLALKYERGEMAAPVVTAKGAGEHAVKMREIARKNRVPIVESKPLARSLFEKVGVDFPIPEDLYPVVAPLLARVFAKRAAEA